MGPAEHPSQERKLNEGSFKGGKTRENQGRREKTDSKSGRFQEKRKELATFLTRGEKDELFQVVAARKRGAGKHNYYRVGESESSKGTSWPPG